MARIFLLLSLFFAATTSYGQNCRDYAVELSATVQVTPPKITLKWKPIPTVTIYWVYKKAKSGSIWSTSLVTLTATDSSYDDLSVIVDSAYEYQVVGGGATFTPEGFIYAAIKSPAMHNKGAIIMLVDTTFTDSCAAELQTMMQDYSGDGWQVIRHDVGRSMSDVAVKALVTADNASHANVKAVQILGHIAVPYSGKLNPDGHPDHQGAWPADIFYSCPTGWTDASVTTATTTIAANRNIPGDGKWDQSLIPSYAQLQVGRVDFYNMPAFSTTEVQMMRSYLNRDHKYKMDSLAIVHRALINDNFGAFSGEAFAANGWRNFTPMVGRDSVKSLPFISTLAAAPYQWAYGCGGGSFTTASGVGATSDFAANPINGIFTMLFGSYFGDWNVQNNFLRAPLCSSTPALTSCWAGRPNWFLHHMALGENIGYGQWLSQNNAGSLYQPGGVAPTGVHAGLMGDLTLRTDYIKPASGMVLTTPVHNGATIAWTASPDAAVLGYYVYRADSAMGYFQKISPMISGTSFRDTVGVSGTKFYMVRPVTLQSTPSGQYYNLGIGITKSAVVSYTNVKVTELPTVVNVDLFPNPAQSRITVSVNAAGPGIAHLYILNTLGQQLHLGTKELRTGNNVYSLDIADFVPGIYNVVVDCGNSHEVRKLVKQ